MKGTSVITCEATAVSPAGSYPIVISTGSITNTKVTFVNGTLTVTKAPLIVKAEDATRVYGEANPEFTITYSGWKLEDNESMLTSKPSATTTAVTTSPAGEYPIVVNGGSATNYELSYQNGTLTVLPVIKVTAVNCEREYGENNPEFTFTVEGGELNGTPVIICEATAVSPAGSYPIVISTGSITNTKVTFVNGTLTVTKAPLIVKAEDATRVYGEANPEFAITYSGWKLEDNENMLTSKPSVTTTAVTTSPVGEYPIIVSGGEARNYQLIYEEGVLTIKKATLTVKLDDASREYVFDNTYAITYSGFKDDNVSDLNALPTVMTEATASSSVGTYQMTLEGGYDDNYEFAFTYTKSNGYSILTVTKAPLTVTADDKVYVKDSNDFPSFSMTFSGFRNGDTEANIEQWPNIYCSANRNSPVGQYPITLSGGYDSNYSLTLQNGTLTITDASYTTVTVVCCEREYGDANPNFTYTVEGGELNGTPNITCSATMDSPVGSYPIAISMGSITNTRVTLINGTLTVTKAPLKVKAEDATRRQGEQNPEFVITYNGWKVSDNENVLISKPTATTTATVNSPMGEYPIIVNGGEAQNYNLYYENGVLTVLEATGIYNIPFNEPVDIYDLQGRKVRYRATTLDDFPKGVYIINGKKYVIK